MERGWVSRSYQTDPQPTRQWINNLPYTRELRLSGILAAAAASLFILAGYLTLERGFFWTTVPIAVALLALAYGVALWGRYRHWPEAIGLSTQGITFRFGTDRERTVAWERIQSVRVRSFFGFDYAEIWYDDGGTEDSHVCGRAAHEIARQFESSDAAA
jgi:hypothetical protein